MFLAKEKQNVNLVGLRETRFVESHVSIPALHGGVSGGPCPPTFFFQEGPNLRVYFYNNYRCIKGVATKAMSPPNPSWTKTRILAEPAPRKPRGSGPPIDMLVPPIKKLTLLKTTAFELNFKLCPPPPPMNALTGPSKSTAQLQALDLGN